jgi:hypothetical protein
MVRAAETVEGRARLYRRSGARDKAAAALRNTAVDRVRTGLGMPRRADPRELTDAVAARTGRSTGDVSALLYGAAPADDDALVRLATDLDLLVTTTLSRESPSREVRRP